MRISCRRPLRENIPALMALFGIWNINFNGARTHAVLPYAQALAQFPAYLQQLEMESNGKSVSRSGESLDYATAPVVWGSAGTVGAAFLLPAAPPGPLRRYRPISSCVRKGGYDSARHAILNANRPAQAEALALGRHDAALEPHRRYPGDRPSSVIGIERLDPRNLGRLIALYEHKVFVQGIVWDINSFDQWGVEYGKEPQARFADACAGTQPQRIRRITHGPGNIQPRHSQVPQNGRG